MFDPSSTSVGPASAGFGAESGHGLGRADARAASAVAATTMPVEMQWRILMATLPLRCVLAERLHVNRSARRQGSIAARVLRCFRIVTAAERGFANGG